MQKMRKPSLAVIIEKPKLLLVDDSEFVLKITSSLLEKLKQN
jgi:CheY-like chemotaxis protein